MRLLETSSTESAPLKLVYKSDDELGHLQYAILSHRWENATNGRSGEVTFVDISESQFPQISAAHSETSTSLKKIRQARKQAAADGLAYIWIDSCCIDKRNSAEESESINSMFAWYTNASICYAFLPDAPDHLSTLASRDTFKNSQRFTRGWTLQETLSPRRMGFFAAAERLSPLLAEATGIYIDVLLDPSRLESQSIAKRMSWAARRQTTRPEDIAYCMMGIFSVNMPPLYGEGKEKAFLRFQEEIMKQSDDQSLFAWVDSSAKSNDIRGLLATSPSHFSLSQSMLSYVDWERRAPYSMTNRGLQIEMNLSALADRTYMATLNCPAPPSYEASTFLAIYLEKLTDNDQQFARIRVGELAKTCHRGPIETIYVRQKPRSPFQSSVCFRYSLRLKSLPPPDVYKIIGILEPKAVAIIFERLADSRRLVAMFGTIYPFQIWFDAQELPPEQKFEQLNFAHFKASWRPSLSTTFELHYHRVRFSVSTSIESASNLYVGTICIESLKPSPETPFQEDAAMKQQDKGQEAHAEGTGPKEKKKRAMGETRFESHRLER
ncbi:HET-domain-containing protein [Xylariaceae sp. FL0255]|nr:HET-domain-containing protein [Xylariaceae sp. FL0255]